ncbi:MAG TPA: hypothetical protein PLP59_12845 [Thermotogota bacterium]|nr:hypothetical protein [Thermotogota bacterium]
MEWNEVIKDLLRVYIRYMESRIIKNNYQARVAQRRGEWVTKICRENGIDEVELYLST